MATLFQNINAVDTYRQRIISKINSCFIDLITPLSSSVALDDLADIIREIDYNDEMTFGAYKLPSTVRRYNTGQRTETSTVTVEKNGTIRYTLFQKAWGPSYFQRGDDCPINPTRIRITRGRDVVLNDYLIVVPNEAGNERIRKFDKTGTFNVRKGDVIELTSFVAQYHVSGGHHGYDWSCYGIVFWTYIDFTP